MNKFNEFEVIVSKGYLSAAKEKAEFISERNRLLYEMGLNEITHARFVEINKRLQVISEEIQKIDIELSIWNKIKNSFVVA